MQFIDVECESEQEKLCFGFDFSSGQEPSEIPVLLQYAEGSLYLYGAILTKNVSFISSNAFGSFGFLSRHCFGERNLSVFVPYTSEENLTYPIYMVLCCACKEREHMSILEEIYYGNIRPTDEPQSDDVKKALSEVVKIEEALGESLTDKVQKEKISELSERYSKLITLTERDGFLQGFRLGAKLMVELMAENN